MVNSTMYFIDIIDFAAEGFQSVCATANLGEIVSLLKPVCIVLLMVILKFMRSSEMHNISSEGYVFSSVNLLKAMEGAKSSIFQAYIWRDICRLFLCWPWARPPCGLQIRRLPWSGRSAPWVRIILLGRLHNWDPFSPCSVNSIQRGLRGKRRELRRFWLVEDL